MTGPDKPTEGAAPQGKKELAAAYDELVSAAAAQRRELETVEPPKPRRALALLALMLVLVVGLAAWVLLSRAPEGESPERRARHLRADMVVVARRIVAFRAEHGRSPRALRELGGAPPGIEYRVLNAEEWELRAPRAADTLTLRSGQNTATFLADTLPNREPATP
jgi:hypothetical protein